ncbi:MAG: kazal domain protein [Chitinophagales bacterium]|nr:kazal domain protein [Chitinophagales bacterium]
MKPLKPILFLLLAIAFCSGTCEENTCKESPKPDCMCTMQYDPVCGCNNKTYGNACQAECDGITEYTKGECK